MKSRQNVIAAAANTFISNHAPARLNTLVDNVLPSTAAEVNAPAPFEQKTPVPRGTLQTFTASIVERVLLKGAKLTDVASILTASELEYVTLVLDEVYAWAELQGCKLKSEAAAS